MFLSNNKDLSGFVLKSRSDEAPVRRRSLVERTGMKNLMQVTIFLLVVDDHLLDDDQHLHGVGVGDHIPDDACHCHAGGDHIPGRWRSR